MLGAALSATDPKMASPAASHLPTDLLSIEDAAKRLGRSRRTLDRWATSHPDELPRHPHTDPDGTARTLVSWRDVRAFCINHNKSLSSDSHSDMSETIFEPDPSVSEQLSNPDTVSETAQTRSDSAVRVSELQHQVTELSARLAQLSATLETTHTAHRREVSLLEERIAELKATHTREVTNLQTELAARRGEASEMRQAAERQQQREATLRWQTATLKGELDHAIAELQTWSGASWLQRLINRPRLPTAPEQLQPLLDVTNSSDEKMRS